MVTAEHSTKLQTLETQGSEQLLRLPVCAPGSAEWADYFSRRVKEHTSPLKCLNRFLEEFSEKPPRLQNNWEPGLLVGATATEQTGCLP